MSGGDELDGARARRFAWRIARPGEAVELPPDDDIAPAAAPEPAAAAEEPKAEDQPDEEKPEGEDWRRPAFEGCQVLAEAVDRVWALVDEVAQARATAQLVERASALGLGLFAIQHYPLQSVRLARLAVRHFSRLARKQQEMAGFAFSFGLSFTHAETDDLLVEVARAGNRRLATPLWMALHAHEWGAERRRGDLATRLADVLDQGPSWACRLTALDWLGLAPRREAAAALRRALRAPHLGVRWRALDVLLELPEGAIEPADVGFLLHDLLVHEPHELGFGHYEVERGYAMSLHVATARLKPPGGHEPLLEILDGGQRGYMDGKWALGVLAAAYPEHALPILERWLRDTRPWTRHSAVEAVGELPLELARPRLLAAASDGAPRVAELARSLWIDRTATPCPVDELAGVALELLDGPPSDRLRGRLAVLRGQSDEARAAMLSVLLGEAPDPEALALIVFALGDDPPTSKQRRLPAKRDAWTRRIARSFGARGLRGLGALAERYPVRGYDGWLYLLNQLVDKGLVRRADRPVVREIALAALDAGPPRDEDTALRLLADVGIPPERTDALRDRFWALTFASKRGWPPALSVLVTWPKDPVLDARLAAELERVAAAEDIDAWDRVAYVAFERRLPEARALVARVFARWQAGGDGRPGDEIARRCGYRIQDAHGLDERWLLGALADPASPDFLVAASLASHDQWRSKARRRLLIAALASDAHDGLAAVEAGITLLLHKEIRPGDRRLIEAAARAPLKQRWDLLWRMLHAGAKLKRLWSHVRPIMEQATDPELVEDLAESLWMMGRDGKANPLLRQVVADVRSPDLRLALEDHLGLSWRPYWQDEPDERAKRRATAGRRRKKR